MHLPKKYESKPASLWSYAHHGKLLSLLVSLVQSILVISVRINQGIQLTLET